MPTNTIMFRLQQKHSRHPALARPPKASPEQLIAQQSVVRGLLGGLAALLLMHVAWAQSAVLLDRVFPWMTIIQGAAIGFGVQRLGLGLDWRFPLIAALLSFPAAFSGNFVVAVSLTANASGSSMLEVMSGLTANSVGSFFTETMTGVDWIFAFCSIAVATFLAKRRLTRAQSTAMIAWEQGQERAGKDSG